MYLSQDLGNLAEVQSDYGNPSVHAEWEKSAARQSLLGSLFRNWVYFIFKRLLIHLSGYLGPNYKHRLGVYFVWPTILCHVIGLAATEEICPQLLQKP